MSESAREVDISEHLSVLRRRWRWVVFIPLLTLLAIAVSMFWRQPVYESTAEVLILTDANQALFPSTPAAADRLMRNPFAERQYLSSEVFREAVETDAVESETVSYELAPADPDQDLADAGILQFVARADTAAAAAATANRHAEAYVEARHEQDIAQTEDQLGDLEAALVRLQERRAADDDELAALRAQLENQLSNAARIQVQADIAFLEEERQVLDLAGQVRETTGEIATLELVLNALEQTGVAARVHNSAEVPEAPIAPDVQRNVVLAAVAGLVLGVAAAIARDLLDGRAFDPVELTKLTDAPVLGGLGVVPKDRDSASLAHAGYRTVLNSLSMSRTPTLRTIAVTSARPSVGKTETVINLARLEAASGSKVLIIDGNLLSPMIISRIGRDDKHEIDVDDVLAARMASTDELIRSAIPRIDILDLFTSGPTSGGLLRVGHLERVLEKLVERYDFIVIDTPAALASVDVRPMVMHADAVIVVYVPTASRAQDVQRTVGLLRGAGVHVAGLVANRAPIVGPGYAYSQQSATDQY